MYTHIYIYIYMYIHMYIYIYIYIYIPGQGFTATVQTDISETVILRVDFSGEFPVCWGNPPLVR